MVQKTSDFNRFGDKSAPFPHMANERCVVSRLRNNTSNAMNRIVGSSPKNQQALMHSSRKRITFGDDETFSSSQQPAGMSYLGGNGPAAALHSLLFDSHNNGSNPAASRSNGTGASTTFTKEEHDSPRNGVRKDVKLISDAAETEELFGTILMLSLPEHVARDPNTGFLTRTLGCDRADNSCRITV